MNKLLTTAELADQVGVTVAAVGSWVRAGKLKPAGKAGKWNLFSPEQIETCKGLVGVRFEKAESLAARLGVSVEELLAVESPECHMPDGTPMYRHKYKDELETLRKVLGISSQ